MDLTSVSRRSKRIARKNAHTRPINYSAVPEQTSTTEVSTEVSTEETAFEPEIYECCICRDELPFDAGVASCGEHFMCKTCTLFALDLALSKLGHFPARCCNTPLNYRDVSQLLTPQQMKLYVDKAKEFFTPRALRVYCADDECRRLVPVDQHDNSDNWFSIARCECGTNTCVGCKAVWRDNRHFCQGNGTARITSDNLPEYTGDCRIKLCPECRTPIELMEACNHMTCARCSHEFCFICMIPWIGTHEDAGCPIYGDPSAGYDKEGYERSARGIHRDTGLDRNGSDRLGQGLGGEPQPAINSLQQVPPSQWERYILRMLCRLPIFASFPRDRVHIFPGLPLTVIQEDCCHSFEENYMVEYSYPGAICPACNRDMGVFFYYCDHCSVLACFLCRDDFASHFNDRGGSRVSVLEWAEDGAPPFRSLPRRAIQAAVDALEADEANWGLQAMFDDLELEMQKDYWLVVEENVGLEGAEGRLSLRLDNNSFSPLLWEEHGLLVKEA